MTDIIGLFADPGIWLALLTLIVLEVVLGVDNLVFVAILSNKLPPEQQHAETMLAIDTILPKLKSVDARAHDVVLLRFFGGLGNDQIGEVLGVTSRTVDRDWRFARSWLFDALKTHEPLPERAGLVAP